MSNLYLRSKAASALLILLFLLSSLFLLTAFIVMQVLKNKTQNHPWFPPWSPLPWASQLPIATDSACEASSIHPQLPAQPSAIPHLGPYQSSPMCSPHRLCVCLSHQPTWWSVLHTANRLIFLKHNMVRVISCSVTFIGLHCLGNQVQDHWPGLSSFHDVTYIYLFIPIATAQIFNPDRLSS